MATATTQRGTSLFSGLVYLQLAAGMILFGSATPVSKLVTEAIAASRREAGEMQVGFGVRVAKAIPTCTAGDGPLTHPAG